MAEILALDQDGNRLMPIVSGVCSSEAARSLLKRQKACDLFPSAFAPEASLGGLWLYFGCWEECHQIVQDMDSPEASFWHAILHRQELDSANSAYWFRHTGDHPVFPRLRQAAEEIGKRYPAGGFPASALWDPGEFITFCERVRQQPGSAGERCALEVQRAEWQLLFDHCAREKK